jgi:hypothetical protein
METVLADPDSGIVRDTYGRENRLRAFGKCTLALCNELHRYSPTDEIEFQFIDNHFQLLESVYLRWKLKHDTT